MAEASSGQEFQNHKNSSIVKDRENDAMELSATASSADLYRMCKKIAQLTKVIYNLNVKNDELEMYQCRMQHDYEKKVWKLSADIQQHVSNAAALMRTESTRSAEMSQLRTHLDEQMALSESLSEELARTKQQHESDRSSAAAEFEQRLAEAGEARQASEAARQTAEEARQEAEAAQQATEAEWRVQSERLTEVQAELTSARAALVTSSQQTEALQQSISRLEQRLREEGERADTYRAQSERAAQAEEAVRRELAAEQRTAAEAAAALRAQLEGTQRQVEEARDREQQLSTQLAEGRTERDRLSGELATAAGERRAQETRLSALSERLQARCDQLQTQQTELEAARHEVKQQAGEQARLRERLQSVQAETGAARGRADQLSQLLIARDATIGRLESELAAAEAAAAHTQPERVRSDSSPDEVQWRRELEEVRRELEEARRELDQSEAQRDDQAQLMQAALEESASLDAECRRRVEALQTATAEREQQLMEDAETRLREVRRDCKRQLEEQQRAAEERLATLRQTVESELVSQRQALDERSASVDRKLAEMEQLRSFEAEVVQLRGLTHELMRELRVGTRQVEMCRVQEARTAEENRRLAELANKHAATVTALQKERQQQEQQARLHSDQQRAALDAQWEDRLRDERRALKAQLDCLHAEEKHLAVESVRLGADQRLQEAEQCVRQLQAQLECAATDLRERQSRHDMELEQREREAESVIAELHRQLRSSGSRAPSHEEKAAGPEAADGAVGDSVGGSTARSPPSAGSSDHSDAEDGGGDARSRLERALRRRPPLQAALAALLSEADRQAALLRSQLAVSAEQHRAQLAERSAADERRAELLRRQLAEAGARADRLQLQLADAHGRAEQLQSERDELRRQHELLSERAAASDSEHLSHLNSVRAQHQQQLNTLQRRHTEQLRRLQRDAHTAAERIAALERLAEESAGQSRPEDLAALARLQEALTRSEQQTDLLRREKQQLSLELANRDASYSRLFPTGAPRVGVLDPTAAGGSGGRHTGAQAPPAPPARQQRRATGRTGKR